jgi:uncharacterized protein YjbJ (UPF0337 family)
MDKDRIVGSAKEAKGAIKETAGKALGDAKLTAEGMSDKTKGKVQNAIGGLKDALKKKYCHTGMPSRQDASCFHALTEFRYNINT